METFYWFRDGQFGEVEAYNELRAALLLQGISCP